MKRISLQKLALATAITLSFATAVHAQQVTVNAVELTEIDPPAPAVPAAPAPPAAGGLGGSAVAGQGFGGYQPFTAYALDGYDGSDGERQIKELEAQIKELDSQIESAKTEAARQALQQSRERLTKRIERARRLLPLQKKVDVKFENATVQQAAQALSDASGIKITADSSIPESTRLTVEARRVRLATVLESMARQSDMIIEPEGLDTPEAPVGIVLTGAPMLKVGPVEQNFPKPLSPWSDAWGTPPTNRFIFAPAGQGTTVWTTSPGYRYELNTTVREALKQAEAARDYAGATSLYRDRVLGTLALNGTGKNIIVVDNEGTKIEGGKKGTITVVEKSKNDKGEQGSWRTIYVVKNGELVKQSRNFYKDK